MSAGIAENVICRAKEKINKRRVPGKDFIHAAETYKVKLNCWATALTEFYMY